MRYRILTADGQALGVEDGRIAQPGARADLTLALGHGSLRAGLINAHDHLHRNHFPRLGSPPYPDAYAWGADIHDRHADEIARLRALDRHEALLFGALKNLLGGVTTVVHHDAWEPAFDDDAFPVRVPRLRAAHSLRLEPDLEARADSDRATGGRNAPAPAPPAPFMIHLAEGTTPEMADEVRRLDALGLLDDRTVAVHMVGVDDDGVRRVVRAGAAIVWCPTSNAFLFGRTIPVALCRPGIDVMIGTDALLTGAGTMLDELRAARRIGRLPDRRLADGVGATAARRLGLPRPDLAAGSPADIVCLRRPLFGATPADVALVIVGGRPRLGDPETAPLFEYAGVPAEPLRVGGVPKLAAAPLARIATDVLRQVPECRRVLSR